MLHRLRQMGSDTARALVVLALVFLTFAHAPVAAAQSGAFTTSVAASYCGSLPDGDGKAYAPCHACRFGDVELPPPPSVAAKTRLVSTQVSYFRAAAIAAIHSRHVSARPRAPPALV